MRVRTMGTWKGDFPTRQLEQQTLEVCQCNKEAWQCRGMGTISSLRVAAMPRAFGTIGGWLCVCVCAGCFFLVNLVHTTSRGLMVLDRASLAIPRLTQAEGTAATAAGHMRVIL